MLGITPGDLPLYRQALRHSSAVPDDRPDLPDNERLEFLGDAVLDAIIGQLLFRTYADQGEGFLTRMRSKLVSRHQLNILAHKITIERVMESNVSRGHETSVPGNALEALIGAIFLDKGFERTRKIVVSLIETHFDMKSVELEDRDGKSRLLEWGQKKRKSVQFRIKEEHTRGRGKLYLCEALVDGQVRGSGKGASKKLAEQQAAQAAFDELQRGQSREGHHRQDQQEPRHTRRTSGPGESRRHGRRRGGRRHRPPGDGQQPTTPAPSVTDPPA